MTTIEIDFDVYKTLTSKRASEQVSYNDVLRVLLGLGVGHQSSPRSPSNGQRDWVAKGVRFPEGTEFRATYKGQTHLGKVENGSLNLNGHQFDNPSSAAKAITKTSVNGWIFWECRVPGKSTWQLMKTLRK